MNLQDTSTVNSVTETRNQLTAVQLTMVSWDKISIPLEIEVSSWGTFTATELLYKQESSDLLIKENISGSNKSASAILMVENISAADLSLVKPKDDNSGSQGGMNARLVLETNVKCQVLC